MKIYGRTRYQTQAFVDQNIDGSTHSRTLQLWMEFYQLPSPILMVQISLTSTHHSVPQILAPFPTVILQGRGQALDKVLEVGVLQGPPQCLVIVAIHRIQVHPQRSRKQNWVLQTKQECYFRKMLTDRLSSFFYRKRFSS